MEGTLLLLHIELTKIQEIMILYHQIDFLLKIGNRWHPYHWRSLRAPKVMIYISNSTNMSNNMKYLTKKLFLYFLLHPLPSPLVCFSVVSIFILFHQFFKAFSSLLPLWSHFHQRHVWLAMNSPLDFSSGDAGWTKRFWLKTVEFFSFLSEPGWSLALSIRD